MAIYIRGNAVDVVTQEFLEDVFQEKIFNFSITSGSKTGQNFQSCVYEIDVDFPELSKRRTEHVFLKAFPTTRDEQIRATTCNSFFKELQVYETLLPKFYQFQRQYYLPGIHPDSSHCFKKQEIQLLPFIEFIYGKATDFSVSPYQSFDNGNPSSLKNCIVLPNLRKTGGGFRQATWSQFHLNHAKLVTKALARFHATSWAYNCRTNTSGLPAKTLRRTFFDSLPFLLNVPLQKNVETFKSVITSSDKLQNTVKQKLLESLKQFHKKAQDVAALYFADDIAVSNSNVTKDTILRIPGLINPNEGTYTYI
jgi:hypothetical protein